MPLVINTRKILFWLIVILLILILVILGYGLFLKKEIPKEKPSETPPTTIVPLSNEPVLGVTLNSLGNQVRYYLKTNGMVIEQNFDGSGRKTISNTFIPGLVRVIWSPNKTKVITENIKGEKFLYDYRINQAVKLDSNMHQIAFSPGGEKIAYQWKNEQLSMADPDGTNWQNIRPLTFRPEIAWTDEGVFVYAQPDGRASGNLELIDPETGYTESVLQNIYGLDISWSPSGQKLLYSETDRQGREINLWVLDRTANQKISLKLPSFVKKCTWGPEEQTLWCASPTSLPQNAILPNDYYNGKISTQDTFWKIDLLSLRAELLAKNTPYDATDLILTPSQNYLLFINKLDGRLYSLRLNP